MIRKAVQVSDGAAISSHLRVLGLILFSAFHLLTRNLLGLPYLYQLNPVEVSISS